jgi:hypothetical protein
MREWIIHERRCSASREGGGRKIGKCTEGGGGGVP